MRVKPAPNFLKGPGRTFWKKILSTYDFREPEQFSLLAQACESLDIQEMAREEIAKRAFYIDRFGASKQSPAFAVMRDAKALFIRIVRELGLTLDSDTQATNRGNRRY
jgi:phage terminase small subunit